MKKSFLTLAAIALVLSFTSCKETSSEKTEDIEVMEPQTEVLSEDVETPAEEVIDNTEGDTLEVDQNANETAVK